MCGVDEISSSLELHCGEIMSLGKGWSLQEKFALGFWCLLLKLVCFLKSVSGAVSEGC